MGKVASIAGYTSYMLQSLKTAPIVVPDGKGGFKQVGDSSGVPDTILKRCLQRMTCWVKLCVTTLQAEFPSFEAMQRYTVFNLDYLAQNRPAVELVIAPKFSARKF